LNKLPEARTFTALASHLKKLEMEASKLAPIELEYVAGPTTVAKSVNRVVGRVRDKLKIFQLVRLTNIEMDWVIASEKGYLWWREYRLGQKVQFSIELWDPKLNELGCCRLSADVLYGAGSSINEVNYQDNVVGTKFVDRGLDYVTRREATHFYQSMFGYGGRCWVADGQATLFETYLESTFRTRDQVISRLKLSPSSNIKDILAQLEGKLSKDTVCIGDSNVAYDLGLLAMEYLYMNCSFQAVHDLQVRSSKEPWATSVPEVLGVSSQSLDAEIASYILIELAN